MQLDKQLEVFKSLFKYTPMEIAVLRQHDEAYVGLDQVLKLAFNTTADDYKHLKAPQLTQMRELLLTGGYTVESAYDSVS